MSARFASLEAALAPSVAIIERVSFSSTLANRCRTSARRCGATPCARGHQRSSEVIKGHQRSSKFIRYHQMSSKFIRCHQSSSDVIRCHRISSEVVRGQQSSSEFIRVHQRSSEVIRGHQSACRCGATPCAWSRSSYCERHSRGNQELIKRQSRGNQEAMRGHWRRSGGGNQHAIR